MTAVALAVLFVQRQAAKILGIFRITPNFCNWELVERRLATGPLAVPAEPLQTSSTSSKWSRTGFTSTGSECHFGVVAQQEES